MLGNHKKFISHTLKEGLESLNRDEHLVGAGKRRREEKVSSFSIFSSRKHTQGKGKINRKCVYESLMWSNWAAFKGAQMRFLENFPSRFSGQLFVESQHSKVKFSVIMGKLSRLRALIQCKKKFGALTWLEANYTRKWNINVYDSWIRKRSSFVTRDNNKNCKCTKKKHLKNELSYHFSWTDNFL